jgi:DNA-binding NarL/FixJ family response regulator
MKCWRILIADDHDLFLDLVQGHLGSLPDFEIAGRVHSGAEALEACRRLAPDALVMDLSMPHTNGIEATRQVKALPTAPRVVILTLHLGEDFELAARDAGADAFLCKTDLEALAPALRRLLSGAAWSDVSLQC